MEVRVRVRKYDGSLHWNYAVRRLGADEHGVWLGCPAGTVLSRGDTPVYTAPEARVLLIPSGTWWVATFPAAPAECEVYCDVTTPVSWPSPDELTMIDLDLDVWRSRPAGTVDLLDEDEFEAHGRKFGYPPEIVARATATADRLLTAVEGRAEPFGAASHRWLGEMAVTGPGPG